jgi:hypothetical protein
MEQVSGGDAQEQTDDRHAISLSIIPELGILVGQPKVSSTAFKKTGWG